VQHLPSLWKLAGSTSVQARIACANLVPLVYIHLSSLQRLRIRGLVNRLMVDSLCAVRSYVLSSVCIRILKSVVTRHTNFSLGTQEEESVTLNWIAHCMIQGSNDNDTEVRKSALQICRILVEYSALGSEMKSQQNQSLIKELYDFIPEIAPPVTTFPSDGTSVSVVKEEIIIPTVADVHIMFCRALPIISRLVEDKEAQIRSYVGTYCGEFCILMGGKWSAILLDLIFTCCRDSVMEVRVAGLSGIPHVVLAFLQDSILKIQNQPDDSTSSNVAAVLRPLASVITAVCSMHRDNSSEVKCSLCRILSQILTLLFAINSNHYFSSSESSSSSSLTTLETTISSTMILLLTDTSAPGGSDSIVLIEMITQFVFTLEKESYTSSAAGSESSYLNLIFVKENYKILINSLQILSKHSNWRVRKLICALIPKLVFLISTKETKQMILELILVLVGDPVFDVRRLASRSLCLSARSLNTPPSGLNGSRLENGKIVEGVLGVSWLDEIILPHVESLRTSRVYSDRILALHMISILILEEIVLGDDVRYNILIQIALALSRDRVANVRIALCEMIGNITPLLMAHHHDRDSLTNRGSGSEPNQLLVAIEESLTSLTLDRDRDVSYFASKALECLEKSESGADPATDTASELCLGERS
jgi:hypothetical protein